MNALHNRISTALDDGRLRFGGLLSVEMPTNGGRVFEEERERIYLTLDIQPATLNRLLQEQREAVISSEIVDVSKDWAAWAVRYQSGSSTQCLLIPLFSAHTARLIERAAVGEVFIVFTSCEEKDIETVLEARLQLSDADVHLLRRRWRPHGGRAAADRVLQSVDILLSTGVGSDGTHALRCEVSAILTVELQRQCTKVMPDFRAGER